jgi:hypothetical protein
MPCVLSETRTNMKLSEIRTNMKLIRIKIPQVNSGKKGTGAL